jgi:hypothetical protein
MIGQKHSMFEEKKIRGAFCILTYLYAEIS